VDIGFGKILATNFTNEFLEKTAERAESAEIFRRE